MRMCFLVSLLVTGGLVGLSIPAGEPAKDPPQRGGQPLTWIHAIGADFRDRINATVEAPDGGFVLAGESKSFQVASPVDYEIWVLKIDRFGFIEWEFTFGEDGVSESCWDVVNSNDGGFLVIGGGQQPGSNNADLWILKLNANGGLVWQKSYGGPQHDWGRAVTQAQGGGYLAAGTSFSLGSTAAAAWLIRIDEDGNSLWQGAYGGTEDELFYDVAPTADGGYVAAGITGRNSSTTKGWVVKVDANGAIQWQKSVQRPARTWVQAILPAADGGYYITGRWFLAKLDANGNILWQHGIGEFGWGLAEDGDGNLYYSATTWIGHVDFSGYRWAKFNSAGDLLLGKLFWAETNLDEWNRDLLLTSDGGFLLSGWTNDHGLGSGTDDAFILKLSPDGEADADLPERIIDFTGPLEASSLSVSDTAVGGALGNIPALNLSLTGKAVNSTVTIHGGNPLIPAWIQWPNLNITALIDLVNQLGL